MREYKKFSKISGLQLNADKTEIFKLTMAYSAPTPSPIEVKEL